jgi:uncharacterized membrane-anchored protein
MFQILIVLVLDCTLPHYIGGTLSPIEKMIVGSIAIERACAVERRVG